MAHQAQQRDANHKRRTERTTHSVTSKPHTTDEEKNPQLLLEEETRDSPSKVKTSNPQNQALTASSKTLKANIEDHLVARATRSHRPQSCRNFGAAAPTSHLSQLSATPCAVHQHRLLGPLPRRTTVRPRAATPHDTTAHGPSCTK